MFPSQTDIEHACLLWQDNYRSLPYSERRALEAEADTWRRAWIEGFRPYLMGGESPFGGGDAQLPRYVSALLVASREFAATRGIDWAGIEDAAQVALREKAKRWLIIWRMTYGAAQDEAGDEGPLILKGPIASPLYDVRARALDDLQAGQLADVLLRGTGEPVIVIYDPSPEGRERVRKLLQNPPTARPTVTFTRDMRPSPFLDLQKPVARLVPSERPALREVEDYEGMWTFPEWVAGGLAKGGMWVRVKLTRAWVRFVDLVAASAEDDRHGR